MNFKSQNPIDASQSERFKLYKSGKLWLVAGLTFFSFLGGSVLNNTNVHADVTTATTTSSSAASTASSASVATQVTSAATTKTTSQAATASSSAATSQSTSTASSSTSQATKTASSSSAATSTSATATSQATSVVSSTATTTQVSRTASSTAASAASSTATVKAVKAASSTVSSAATTATKATAKVAAVAYTAATTSSTDVWTIGDTTRPRVDVVDVASYQSTMTQSDFNKLKAAGVKTVIVKSTEGTDYTNPAALNQAKMANKAGLNVDFYHYATFSTADAAKSEATNMAGFLVKNNVSTKVLLFADMEDSSSYSVNATANLNAFWSTLDSFGYKNHGVYTSNSYLYRDAVVKTVGQSRVWRAQYPYTPSANNLWNTNDGAWQFSDTALLPSGSDYTGYIDVSIDYNGLTEDSAGTNTFVTTTSSNDTTTSEVTTDTSATTNTSTSSTTKKASGWYTFTKNTAIKSAASDSAKTVGTYSKGNRVYYNAEVTTNGETWLRYLSYSGSEHFVKIAAAKTTTTKPAASTSKTVTKNETGTYKFTKTTAIKGSVSDSAKTLGTYYKGDTVYYNAKVTKNGETWLRYLSYSGAQHYVKISGAATSTTTTKPATSASKTVTKAETGTYKFTGTTAIKGSVNDSAKTLGTYYKGDTVYYNAKVTKNGQTWLRYLSYSGAQHYVKISGAATTTTSSKSTASAKTVAQTGTYKFAKTTAIKSSASDAASTVGTYYKGNTVNYNAKVTTNGQTWLRYTSYSGAQHYVKVSGGAATTTSSSASKTTAAAGTYTFKTTTNIRTAASLNASVVGQYYAGESVYYIGTVSADGYQWLKYLSNSGAYHYVAKIG
ncbi:SH3 domain-containing protein [Lactiplantibacillus plantarum]|uniref:SH3 domain-containing protein n=1 Tax=Lactiplantibacillus plantarum TaxID=1590 RepID=UPI0007EE735F|nr:SH3 domain-containing protein [Lactiplantibacillus plantarum]MCM8649187.1 SH3 domain-containing protein [Lactiplantibacillus sp. E932]MCT1240934.1 glycoside hydrolase family 25 [Lactiplantibacillus plantarum]MDO7546531.1 SH3 domain-containing protein [Lactiplantibacillus plantarum]OBS42076.1 glycoside hydrolase family 25 [Lactiplantibacillus plantarum]QJS46709.1 KxYKxGKxW signal peptide domain-containing protein [Lactiplantibacillus plantarum]